jgi:ectoine hydroxylase-related dioxygenase (phytanoyl-CoA dioxygenase family)
MMFAQAKMVDARPQLTANWTRELQDQGYCIIRDLIPRTTVSALHDDLRERFSRTPFSEGEFYGSHTKRFGGVLKRSRHAEALVAHPAVLEIANDILGPYCDRVQLNLTQALEIHPGSQVQVPHRDQNMWRGPHGEIEYLLNVMWPFTPYTAENGATLVWPGSNHLQDALFLDDQDTIPAEMEPGDALLFLGSTLHCAGANRSLRPRSGMVVSYCLGWLKPYENQWLVYPPSIARTFSKELAELAGYRIHRPNLGNYEGQCPSILLEDRVPEFMGAVDELPPDQIEPLAQYNAMRARAV